jgi:hypothetical protein
MDSSRSKHDAAKKALGPSARLFVHIDGEIIQAPSVPVDGSLGDALRLAGIELTEELVVLAARTEFRSDPEASDDDDVVVALDVAVSELAGITGHAHVVVHCCRRVEVSVRYQSRTIERRFSPARTVGDVRTWALRKLQLHDAASDKLVLEICDSDRRPRPEIRIATLVGTSCALCFDLVPEKIVEG